MTVKASPSPLQRGLVRRGYTDCRYGQLHYARAAPPAPTDKPTLVLLHQNPSSWFEYMYLAAAMGDDREVICFDTPGNGMSDGVSGPLPMADYAAAFSDGMEALGLGETRKVDVFGFHTGTLLCVELALMRPDRVGRVVLSGIPNRPEPERVAALQKGRDTPIPTDDGEAMFTRLRWMWDYLVTQRDKRVPVEAAADMFIERARSLHRYWWPYEAVYTYPIQERLSRLTQPTLVLQPHEELLEPSRQAASYIPDCVFKGLPDLQRDIFAPEVGVAILAKELREFLV